MGTARTSPSGTWRRAGAGAGRGGAGAPCPGAPCPGAPAEPSTPPTSWLGCRRRCRRLSRRSSSPRSPSPL